MQHLLNHSQLGDTDVVSNFFAIINMLQQASYYNILRAQIWLFPYVKYLEVELLHQMESTFYTLLHSAYIASPNFEENKILFSWFPPISLAILSYSPSLVFPPMNPFWVGIPQSYVLLLSSSPSKTYNLKCLQEPRRYYKYISWTRCKTRSGRVLTS